MGSHLRRWAGSLESVRYVRRWRNKLGRVWIGRSRIQERLLLTLGHLTLVLLLLLAFMALGCWFQLWKSRGVSLETANHTIVIWAILLLCLFLFSLCGLALVSKMGRYTSINVVNTGNLRLNQPRSTGPCLSRNRLLDE